MHLYKNVFLPALAVGPQTPIVCWFFVSFYYSPIVERWMEEPIWPPLMAPHSCTIAWKIPWTEEPGRLQSMGSQRVGHDWATSLSLSCIGEGNGNPLQCSCLENSRGGRAWWAAVYGVTQSRTRLKWLSSSSSSNALEFVSGINQKEKILDEIGHRIGMFYFPWWLSSKESACNAEDTVWSLG